MSGRKWEGECGVQGGIEGAMGEGSGPCDVGPEGTPTGSEQLLQLFFIPCCLQGAAAAWILGCDLQQV